MLLIISIVLLVAGILIAKKAFTNNKKQTEVEKAPEVVIEEPVIEPIPEVVKKTTKVKTTPKPKKQVTKKQNNG